MSDENHAAKLAGLTEAFPGLAPRLEDHVLIFHTGCGGIVVGALDKTLICAVCGQEMTAFISAAEEKEFLTRQTNP